MSPNYLIRTLKPEECVNFYTRVLGLKLHQPQHCGNVQQSEHVSKAPQRKAPRQEKNQKKLMAMRENAVFKLDHRCISRLSDTGNISKKEMTAVQSALSLTEMYFIARIPLKDIYARLQAQQPDHATCHFVQHEGNAQRLRILELLDPDGNRLRLVELG